MRVLSVANSVLWLATVSGLVLQKHEMASIGMIESAVAEEIAIPTTTWCTVFVICQYMVVYLALFLVRTFLEFTREEKSNVERALANAAQTLTYGPMLCVLFIACRLRVEGLSDGKGNPQWWVQACMYLVTFAVFAQTVLVLIISLVMGKPVAVDEETGEMEELQQDENDSKSLFFTLTASRYGVLCCMYGGLLGIIVGIFTYLPPGATDISKLPPPVPSVMCTMHIAVLFFVVQLIVAGCRSYSEFKGVEQPRLTKIMIAAAATVEFGPMIAIVFLSLRMRALQHDSEPQSWAMDAMYFSTAALTLTTLMAILVPIVLGGKIEQTDDPSNPKFNVQDAGYPKCLGYGLIAIRYICMMSLYGGVFVVMYGIVTFRASGHQETRPISPTVECVLSLATQYFVIYFLLMLMITASEISGWDVAHSRMHCAVEAAKGTLAFAPMLAILFVTVRMYSLLLSNGKGSPQKYCQEGMFMATYAVLIQCIVCLLSGLFMGKVEVKNGNVVNKFENAKVGALMTVVRYTAMIMLYSGICTVIFGLLSMTPENADGMQGLPVTPIHQAPPNPGDLASALRSVA